MIALRILLMFIFSWSIYVTTCGQTLSKVNKLVDDYFRNIGVSDTTPGGALAVIHQGKVIFKKGYGLANLEHKIPFTAATISDIGSVAKQMTVMGILQLIKKGQLAIDDPLRKYIPCPEYLAEVTIRQLMQHTSGIKEVYALLPLMGWKQGDRITQQDAKNIIANVKELNFSAGANFSYSNTGYMMLAEVIEDVAKLSFEAYMQKNIFKPLDMNHTYIMDYQGKKFPNMATSYHLHDKYPLSYYNYHPTFSRTFTEVYDNSEVIGAGGVYTSLDDLILWAQHLRQPKPEWKPWVDSMKVPATLTDGSKVDFYGLGLDLHQHQPRSYGHTGSSAGYRANLIIYPEVDLIIITKTNRPDLDFNPLFKQVLAHFGFLDPANNDDQTESIEEENNKDDEWIPDSNWNASATGNYYNAELQLTIQLKMDGKLRLNHPRLDFAPLILSKDYQFRVAEHPEFHDGKFIIDSSGAVLGFRLNSMLFRKWP